jgi:prevent-host-death family protein
VKDVVSAADANRSFSKLLRRVREGRRVVVTSHGKPIATLAPIDPHEDLRAEPAVDVGRWTRDELYED